MKCTCGEKLEGVREHKIFKGEYAVLCEFYRCPVCGEELFDENQTSLVTKEIDKLDEKLKHRVAFEVRAPSFVVHPV